MKLPLVSPRTLEALFKADALGLDAGDYREMPRSFHQTQLVSLLGLAAVVLFLPLGQARFVVSLLLVTYTLAQVVLRNRLIPEYSDGVQMWLATVVAMSCASILPGTLVVAAVSVTGIIVSGAQRMGRAAYGILALSTCWLAVIYAIQAPPKGYLTILVFVAICPGYIKYSLWAAAQYELRRQREQMLLESGRALTWELDQQSGRLLTISGPIEELLGYSEEDAIERLTPDRSVGMSRELPTRGPEWTYKVAHADGSDRWFRISAMRRTRADGLPIAYGVAIDITDVEQGRLSERKRANRDPLTGLANRNGFAKFLDEAVDSVYRAVLVIDLDRFKEVNDSLGHPVGDRLIAAVAMRLNHLNAKDVCVARLGGDEFAIALVADDEAAVGPRAERLADHVRSCLQDSFTLDSVELTTSASIGIAAGSNLDWSELLRRADGAMYSCKRGDGDYHWYDPVEDSGSANRFRRRSELARDLESQIVLHYQPILSASDRELVSLEALARWEHPERGLLGPHEFLPLIASSGDSVRFDRHILSMAVKTAADLAALPNGPTVAVNLHPESLWSPSLIGQLRSLLREYPLAAKHLVLEVTEQGLSEGPGRLLHSLNALKTLGLSLAIDDFGTGNSSLMRLRTLPFDVVKIDRSFVSGVPTNAIDTTIVRSTIELAEDLGMRTVAEGVETPETADALEAMGCTKLQGWLFAKAMPLADVLEQWNLTGGDAASSDLEAVDTGIVDAVIGDLDLGDAVSGDLDLGDRALGDPEIGEVVNGDLETVNVDRGADLLPDLVPVGAVDAADS